MAAVAAGMAMSANAEPLTVTVVDRDGLPVADVAVYLDGVATVRDDDDRPTAVMDQRDKQFDPHILVIRTGTAVEFPNSDITAHHVYSFSRPNDFVLPLYKGDPPNPVTFGHAGVVTLGCNIHDNMLAYIVVVDTPVFGKTGDDGQVTLSVPEAADVATLSIWSPRIVDKPDVLARDWTRGTADVRFALHERLRPAHDDRSEAIEWSEY